MFILGWIWFKQVTNLTIFEMVSKGGLEWLTYPLLLRVLYFQLWFYIALMALGIILFSIAVILPMVKGEQQSADNSTALSGDDHYYLNRLVNMPNLSSLQFWRNKKQIVLCSICQRQMTDENRTKLECGHLFHTSCLSVSTSTILGHDATCPICKEPVLVEISR
jgi:hypothetical protein